MDTWTTTVALLTKSSRAKNQRNVDRWIPGLELSSLRSKPQRGRQSIRLSRRLYRIQSLVLKPHWLTTQATREDTVCGLSRIICTVLLFWIYTNACVFPFQLVGKKTLSHFQLLLLKYLIEHVEHIHMIGPDSACKSSLPSNHGFS